MENHQFNYRWTSVEPSQIYEILSDTGKTNKQTNKSTALKQKNHKILNTVTLYFHQ